MLIEPLSAVQTRSLDPWDDFLAWVVARVLCRYWKRPTVLLVVLQME